MASAKKKQKQRRNRIIFSAILAVILLIAFVRYLYTTPMSVLQPAGPIADGQKQLLVTAFLLMLIIVIPVFVLAFSFAWRYRETNPRKATYKPNWDHSNALETIWWLIPTALIAVLAVMTWQGTFKYDPYRPLAAEHKTLTVQVVALDWRWLFIYPDQKVASVNELYMPVNTPVKFEITADAPMNSFWIPQLGGQIYAMPGMGTMLNLQADHVGRYYGSSANISGAGFANMNFTAVATSDKDFMNWVKDARTQKPLTKATYDQLAEPSKDQAVMTFGHPANDLYGTIISKYMHMDHSEHQHMDMNMEGM